MNRPMNRRKKGTTPKTAPRVTDDRDRALYVISVAAELSGVHPQTLRMYERKGLLQPKRTEGRARRYSDRNASLSTRASRAPTW